MSAVWRWDTGWLISGSAESSPIGAGVSRTPCQRLSQKPTEIIGAEIGVTEDARQVRVEGYGPLTTEIVRVLV
jgi:hypothetical protein